MGAAPKSITLEQSVEIAMATHYDVTYAKAAREKSLWMLREAQNNTGVSLTYSHSDLDSQGATSGANRTFDNKVALNWTIYSGGSLEGKIKQAAEELQVADLAVELAKQQLKLNVISEYLTAVQYQKIWMVNQETVQNYTQHLQTVKNKYEAGTVAKIDILSSQVDLAKAQDNLVQAENNYRNAIAALNNELRLPHDTELDLQDTLRQSDDAQTLEECLAYAHKHRPDIAQASARVAEAKAGIDVAYSGYRPTVTITASQDWNDTQFPGAKNSNWSVKAMTSLSLFDSGITHSKVAQAQYNMAMLAETKGKAEDAASLEVRQYYLSMQEAVKRIETSQLSVQQAEESLAIQKMRYEVGVGTNLDLRDAVLSLDQAQKDHTQALFDYNLNKAKLAYAMGVPVG